MFTENLKSTRVQKPTPSSRILVVFPRLNQGEWIFPLVHTQHNLEFVMSGWIKDQWKINITYGVF